jgi:acetyltransferase-like isoleucine patch superfamily enzyme
MARPIRRFRSHGDGSFEREQLGRVDDSVVLEAGVRIFDPQNVFIESNVYIGHDTHMVGYHSGRLCIGADSWIGPGCYLHGAGTLDIGRRVGIGAGVHIITSVHIEEGRSTPILYSDLTMAAVVVEDDVDIGVGATILPGVHIGRGVQIGAGTVVTHDVPEYAIVAGVPARVLRMRPDT